MIDITAITKLISAFSAETVKDSISPERMGGILQQMANLLTDAKCATRHAPHRLLPDIVEKILYLRGKVTTFCMMTINLIVSFCPIPGNGYFCTAKIVE